ncbi:DsrE/DsrF/DrsH-like family protein [Myxococcota bacterium]|nr:DsrE/DsrF/DrsH-like family protein [Myxococcota bacterium]
MGGPSAALAGAPDRKGGPMAAPPPDAGTATEVPGARDLAALKAEVKAEVLSEVRGELDALRALVSRFPPDAVAVRDKRTIVVFSGDYDKLMAAFIIATGAASMGTEVSMYFTFWGLNALRRPSAKVRGKSLVERAFGWMMPAGPKRQGISKMNMMGLGGPMIRQVMKAKNVEPLEGLMALAQEMGVRMIACQMSMDILGIRGEELVDGLQFGGVATYLGDDADAQANLFI